MLVLLAAAVALLANPTPGQATRVHINGTPTNLVVDWSAVATAPDPTTPNTFLALLPIHSLSMWASFESSLSMDVQYGVGNWLRCRMTARDWAYLSLAPCAQLPGNNAGVPYAAPMSLLTTNYDFGPYTGVPGQANTPLPGAALFGQSPQSYIQGLGGSLSTEVWELRTRGFAFNDLWNGCAASSSVSANFNGWLVARFSFAFT